jgi:hypothetical protein
VSMHLSEGPGSGDIILTTAEEVLATRKLAVRILLRTTISKIYTVCGILETLAFLSLYKSHSLISFS